MKIAVRGYGDGKLLFDEVVDADAANLEQLAVAQIERVTAYQKNMIEIEFIDDPDPINRFFRFGTDPSGMVVPIELPL